MKSGWRRIPASRIDRTRSGRVASAYTHPDGLVLLHFRPSARTASWHKRVGLWAVGRRDRLLGQFSYYGRAVVRAPIAWANGFLSDTADGGDKSPQPSESCPTVVAAGLLRCLQATPLHPEELPIVLVGAAGRRRNSAPISRSEQTRIEKPSWVRTALPSVPPHRTVRGRYAGRILCQWEFEVYMEMWAEWATEHPKYAEPAHRHNLHTLCIERVLQYRILAIMFAKPGHMATLARLYDSSSLRMQRARKRLTATGPQPAPAPGTEESDYAWLFAGHHIN